VTSYVLCWTFLMNINWACRFI